MAEGATDRGADTFVHLHVHSEYSMLDGAARVADLFQGCAELGMPAIAMTDHGNLFGAYEFYKALQDAGSQADHRPGGVRHPQDPSLRAQAGPLGRLGRQRGRRRVRRRRVHPYDDAGRDHRGHAQPVPARLAGEPRGLLLQAAGRPGAAEHVRQGADRHHRLPERARCRPTSGSASTTRRSRSAAEFRDIFGQDNYFVELMDHGLSIENRVRADLLRIAKDLKLPLVATNDLHYAHPGRRGGPRGAALRPVRLDDGRRRTGSSSTATATT